MSKAAVVQNELYDCSREPIHIPGSIQPHGYLYLLDAEHLTILAMSANAADVAGAHSTSLVGKHICEILVSTQQESLNSAIKKRKRGAPVRLRFRQSSQSSEWDGIAHLANGVILLELWPRVGANATEALLAGISFAIERIRSSDSPEGACDALANEIRRITGFDRVMVYRFDSDWNGEVIAEDRATHVASYLGHVFPASDIPSQARTLYRRNTIRLIPDASYTPSPIVPHSLPSFGRPIDLSAVMLRSVAPVHREYLANMGVAASMSVSLLRDGQLWGLAIGHHSVARSLEISVLQTCELLTQATAWYMDAHERSAATECVEFLRNLEIGLTSNADDGGTFQSRLESIAPAILEVTHSDGAAFCDGQIVCGFGSVPAQEQILDLTAWLSTRDSQSLSTNNLSTLFPAAASYCAVASGIAANQLPGAWLILFRPEWQHTRIWAGDPSKVLAVRSGKVRINPRKSFASWQKATTGRSRPWTSNALFAVGEVTLVVLRMLTTDQIQRLAKSELELMAAKAKAEEASHAKSKFLANMSHELRTPLNSILGFSDFIKDYSTTSDPKTLEYVSYINDSGRHLLSLINDLLDMSKIEAGKYQLFPETFDPIEVIEEASRGLRLAMEKAGIHYHPPTIKNSPPLVADRRALKQILINLLSNSIKFTPRGGLLSVLIEPIEGALRLTVKDTGKGMSAELLSRIARPFEQSDDSYNRSVTGTGLGLALTKKLVELHGGLMEVLSAVDVGTSVSVLFPL